MSICSECGTQLPENAKFCPSCGAEVIVNICSGCGTQLPEKAEFCPSCGARVSPPASQLVSTPEPTAPTPTIRPKNWVLIAIAGISFLAGLIYLLQRPSQTQYDPWTGFVQVGFATFWILSGYVGAFWLMRKGYFIELTGCAILAGGLPILLPLIVGPFFLVAAYFLPDRLSSK